MYKLIVVDDDVHVLEGFKRKVDWASLNVEIVGTADNGLDGLDIIKQLKPDIVMTDIKMPMLDGIGLMKKIQELDFNIKVVVLSGFGEFEFAKQAMKYNAVDYLLKPTSKEEVSQLTAKLVQMLEEEKKAKSIIASHKFLAKLKTQPELTSFRELAFQITNQDALMGATAALLVKPGKKLKISELENLLIETPDNLEKFILRWDNSTWIIIYLSKFDSATLNDLMNQVSVNFQARFKEHIYKKVRVAVGNAMSDIEEVKLSLESALELMEFRTITNEKIVLHPNNFDKGYKDFSDLKPLARSISVSINKGAKDSVIRSINAFFEKVSRKNVYSKRFYDYILAVSFKSISMCRKLPAELLGNQSEYTIWKELTSKDSIETLERYVLENCRDSLYNSGNKRHQNYTAPIKFVIKSIIENYKDSLLIKDIAESLYISDNYLTTLFKKETGTSFKKYLTAYRMQKAKELLENPKYMIQQIAEMVGYKSEEHFSKTFKTTTGLSPKKYRTNIIYKTNDILEK